MENAERMLNRMTGAERLEVSGLIAGLLADIAAGTIAPALPSLTDRANSMRWENRLTWDDAGVEVDYLP